MVEQMRQKIERDVRAWTDDDGILVELASEPGRIVLACHDVERLRRAVERLVGLGCVDEGMAACAAGPPPTFRRVVAIVSHPEPAPGVGVNPA